MNLTLALLFLILSACATPLRAPKVYLGSVAYLQLPQPNEIATLKAVQVITVTRDGVARNFETIFENKGAVMTISILSPLWPTPMKVTYNGVSVSVDAALKKNIPFDFKYVVADLMLIYAKTATLRKNLNVDSKLLESGNTRKIVDVKSERTIVEIIFDSEDPFKGIVRLNNRTRGYEIEIKTVRVEQ